MAGSLSDKLFSELDGGNKKTRTDCQQNQTQPQNIFASKGRRQGETHSSGTASQKQWTSNKKNNNIASFGGSVLPSKFHSASAQQHFGTTGRNFESSSPLLSNDNQGPTYDNFGTNAKESDETPELIKSSTLIGGNGHMFLENLIGKDPTYVVQKLSSSKWGFSEFLNSKLSSYLIYLTIRLLAEKVCMVGFLHSKTDVLIAAMQPFFLSQLENEIQNVAKEHKSNNHKILPFLENLLIFYETVVNVLPQTACEKLKRLFIITELAIEGAQKYQNINSDYIKKKFESLNRQLKTKMEENQSSKFEQLQYLQPPDNFRHSSIFPTAKDLANKPFLRPSIIKGAYIDAEHYLDVQFRLLREDFVGPLREGISQYVGQKRFKKINNLRIYHDAQFVNVVTIKEKVGVLLNFDIKKKLRNFHWEHSKRFMFGSLLCFTYDNFGTIFFGAVLERDKKQLEKGCVVVELFDQIDTNIFYQKFTVAESEIYFDPYRQVLNALQTIPFASFPLKSYIVDGVVEVNLPLYIRAKSDSVKYSIGDFKMTITEMDAWPVEDDLNLDSSQYKSFKSALTKEFVLIQGPPGTGKTFLGLKILKTFIDNQNLWNKNHRPILVVCSTNQALDQVLEGTLKYTRKIIRIGGQSKCEALGEFNLKEVRRHQALRTPAASSRAIFVQMQEIMNHIHSLQQDIEKISNNSAVISISSLKEVGITAKLLESFMNKNSISEELFIEWLKGDRNKNQSIELLQNDANPFNITNLEGLPCEKNYGGVSNVDCVDGDDDDNDECNRVNIFNDEYDLAIQTVQAVRLKYVLELSHLTVEVQRCKEMMERCGDNSEDYVKYQNLWLYNMGLYRFFKYRLAQAANIGGSIVERLTCVHNLWDLNIEERWYLYKYWSDRLYSTLTKRVFQLQAEYKQLCIQYDQKRDLEDIRLLKEALIVGMTTTGAAWKQLLLQELKPRIVIVEEAAEVLESHIVVSLTKACEHLILIGDHKQLRPSTAVYELAKKFNFDISLFERMIQNGMQYDCLEVQHRMRPEIVNLITPQFYPTLKSALSVYEYENVKGVTKNLFFINHRHNEEEVSETVSCRNVFEAQFLLAFCRYLLLQGYQENEITILTTYSGQMYYMRKLKKEYGVHQNVQITVVDNFQGQENKIILLSLVRSNKDGNIGFLKVENRVCVALSRAKVGLYIVGNMDNLAKSTKIWQKINETLMKHNSIGNHLTLKCQVHPNEETTVASAADFKAVPEGGCSRPCEAELTCGHSCQSVCHVKNRTHENYKCFFPCERVPQGCLLGHKCPKKCFQDCGLCEMPMDKVDSCEHVTTLPCHIDVSQYQCKEAVEVVLEPCKHKTNKLCHEDVKTVKCPFPCEDRLLCGHSCTRNCHAGDDPDHIEYKCHKPCGRSYASCKGNHTCNKKCYEECGECPVEVKVQLICGHTHQIRCNSDPKEVKCNRDCKRTMACGHVCRLQCSQPCEACPVPVQKIIPDCGHEVRLPCCKQPTRSMCKKCCERLLECGHHCKSLCCSPCSSECEELVPSHITPACGHSVDIPCHLKKTELKPYSHELLSCCKMPCGKTLECDHLCAGTCGACFQGRLHVPCKEKCGRVQICGHSCNIDCAKNCSPCNQKCEYRCRHSRCSLKCGVPCVPCREPCGWRCKHLRCTKLCYELCDRGPCYEPCNKKRRCGHDCVGFCGETCPPLCRICDKEQLTTIVFGFEDEEDSRFVYLEDCKHIIESKALDEWLKKKDDEITLKSCPLCKTAITRTLRFLNYLKILHMDICNVKERVFGNPIENTARRLQLHQALNQVVLPDKVKHESTEIQKMLTLLQSNLQTEHKNRRLFLSRPELESLSIKIDFVSKLLKTLGLFDKVLNGTPFKLLIKQFDKLVYLLRTRNTNMSQQEVNDFNLEVSKFVREAQLRSIQSSSNFTLSSSYEVIKNLHKKALQEIKSIERYTSAQDQKLKELLEKLNSTSKAVIALDTATIRREIVKAVGLTAGHWFKCPNGHYCVIANCGGAIHEGICPDCGTKIGGSNYQLHRGNHQAVEIAE